MIVNQANIIIHPPNLCSLLLGASCWASISKFVTQFSPENNNYCHCRNSRKLIKSGVIHLESYHTVYGPFWINSNAEYNSHAACLVDYKISTDEGDNILLSADHMPYEEHCSGLHVSGVLKLLCAREWDIVETRMGYQSSLLPLVRAGNWFSCSKLIYTVLSF